MDALQTYEVIKNYLLEKKFATTEEEANTIILNMEESWFQQINEEDADRLRDQRMERGGVDGNTNYRNLTPSLQLVLLVVRKRSMMVCLR